jgi:IS605 OrfB family transposase
MESYLQVASRRIVEHLVHWRIGPLITGKNAGCKQAVTLGKRTTQTVVFLPPARFIQRLAYQAQLVGIQVIVPEESYTKPCYVLGE